MFYNTGHQTTEVEAVRELQWLLPEKVFKACLLHAPIYWYLLKLCSDAFFMLTLVEWGSAYLAAVCLRSPNTWIMFGGVGGTKGTCTDKEMCWKNWSSRSFTKAVSSWTLWLSTVLLSPPYLVLTVFYRFLLRWAADCLIVPPARLLKLVLSVCVVFSGQAFLFTLSAHPHFLCKLATWRGNKEAWCRIIKHVGARGDAGWILESTTAPKATRLSAVCSHSCSSSQLWKNI